MKYVYPKLPSAGATTCLIRFSGSGLANCLYVYARAVKLAKEQHARLITPTWFNLSLGPYFRHQPDKRHYLGLFNSKAEISGLNKLLTLVFKRRETQVVAGLGSYFADLLDDVLYISRYIEEHVEDGILKSVNHYDFENCVGVHIRLGDYPKNVRVPIAWYKEKINNLSEKHPEYRFIIFSDGKDEELQELISMPNVERVFFGNALADIFAISRCCYVIGSDSTFSGWGVFLGQVPCVFYRKHYGPVLKNRENEIVENDENRW